MGKQKTLSKNDAELRVRLLHLSASSAERLSATQTVPETETTEMLISNATNSAKLLSRKKNLHASCRRDMKHKSPKGAFPPLSSIFLTLTPLTEGGVFLESTKAECRNRLCLHESRRDLYFFSEIQCRKHSEMDRSTYGMTRAPRRAIASLVALLPPSRGTKSPFITSEAGGFT